MNDATYITVYKYFDLTSFYLESYAICDQNKEISKHTETINCLHIFKIYFTPKDV